MSIEDGGLAEAIVESADEEDWEDCPCCGYSDWLRAIATYPGGACFVVYCGECGKPVQKRWNIAP